MKSRSSCKSASEILLALFAIIQPPVFVSQILVVLGAGVPFVT